LGRGDDVLRIGYDSVDYGAVQEVLARVGGLSGTLQMEKVREQGKDRLILRVETALDEGAWEQAKVRLVEGLMRSRPSLREFVEKGTVWPVKVECWGQGTLPRNPKTGKLLRVVDVI